MCLFPAELLSRALAKLFAEDAYEIAPAAFVAPSKLVIRKIGMNESH